MKTHIISLLCILVFFIGFSVLLYPTISDYFNSLSQSRVVARYFDEIAGTDDKTIQELLDAARDYNKRLLQKENRFQFSEEETAEYTTYLNTGHGTIGVLTIEKIDVKLAIYHGTDEGVLQVGLGHMQGTSLPVGGAGTHAFITGHRGLPSSKLLTNLHKIVEGDTFVLYILGETLSYQVDQIDTVDPEDVHSLNIDPEMDYCTLVTCTPYGVNSHRLLVRGHRVENSAAAEWNTVYSDAKRLDKIMIILIFMIPILPVLIIYFIIRCIKIYRRKPVGKYYVR